MGCGIVAAPHGQHALEEGQIVRLRAAFLQHGKTGRRLGLVGLFRQLAADEKTETLIAIPLPEIQTGHNGVVGGDVQFWMRRFHGVDLKRRQTGNGGKQFIPDVVVFHARQRAQRHNRAPQQPVNVFQPLELGKTGGLVAGMRAEIPAQLRNLRYGPHGGLGRSGSRARRKDNFRRFRERCRVPGNGAHRRQRHAQGEILENQFNAVACKGIQQRAQDGVVVFLYFYGGRFPAFPVHMAADMALD